MQDGCFRILIQTARLEPEVVNRIILEEEGMGLVRWSVLRSRKMSPNRLLEKV